MIKVIIIVTVKGVKLKVQQSCNKLKRLELKNKRKKKKKKKEKKKKNLFQLNTNEIK